MEQKYSPETPIVIEGSYRVIETKILRRPKIGLEIFEQDLLDGENLTRWLAAFVLSYNSLPKETAIFVNQVANFLDKR